MRILYRTAIDMKILLGSIQQETNTFSEQTTRFEEFDYSEGEAMLQNIAAYDCLRKAGIELFPTIYANAVPSGVLSASVFDRLTQNMTSRIPTNIKLDGIWLYLHGAMLIEGNRSGELTILKRIREIVGKDPIISVALDFHANLPVEITKYADIIVGYKTAPHKDMKETQILAAELLLKCLSENRRPKPQIVKLPMMLSGDTVLTDEPPMKDIMDLALKTQQENELLDLSVFSGQSWVDCAHSGASVVANGYDSEVAFKSAQKLATAFWNKRFDFHFGENAMTPSDAVKVAMADGRNLVFISDTGDNTTAGASGKRVEMLEALLAEKAKNALFGAVYDTVFVDTVYEREIGDILTLKLGESENGQNNYQFELVHKGRILSWDGFDGGRAVVVRIEGVDVIVTEQRASLISPEIYRSIGIELEDYKIIVVKLGYLYPKLKEVARKSIFALSQGQSCVKIENLNFHNLPGKVFPIDQDACFE